MIKTIKGMIEKEYKKKYREAHKEQRKEYMRKWREKNREQIREYNRKWDRKNREKSRKTQHLILLMVIGDRCAICGSTKKIHFHEIHGKKHETSFKYYIEHVKDFIPLCTKHHGKIHTHYFHISYLTRFLSECRKYILLMLS